MNSAQLSTVLMFFDALHGGEENISSEEIFQIIVHMGPEERILNGHVVNRIFIDEWQVDGKSYSCVDTAIDRILE